MRKNGLFILGMLAVALVCGIFLTGCVSTPKSTSIQLVNAVEVLGKKGVPFQGRMIKIVSDGNEFTSADTVRENALIRATWETYQLGYEYFMIISENSETSHSAHTTQGHANTRYDQFGNARTTYSPGYTYTTKEHSITLIIMACTADELPDDVPTFAVSSRLLQAQDYFD